MLFTIFTQSELAWGWADACPLEYNTTCLIIQSKQRINERVRFNALKEVEVPNYPKSKITP